MFLRKPNDHTSTKGKLTEGIKHLLIGVELVVGGGQQLVSSEDGVGAGHEAKSLLGLGEANTSSRETDHGLGHNNTGSGDHTDHVPDLDGLLKVKKFQNGKEGDGKCQNREITN